MTVVGAGNVLNKLIDKLPFELHIPSYNFCGPGTKLEKRLARGDKGVNELDEACKKHDMAYADESVDRREADKILADKAWQLVKRPDIGLKQKIAAVAVMGAMKGKRFVGAGTMDRIAKEVHAPARRNYPRRHVITKGPRDLFQADLVEMLSFSRRNQGYRYLLMVIDTFTKEAWALPLRKKRVWKSVQPSKK